MKTPSLSWLNKPEYIFRPKNVLRRLMTSRQEELAVELPTGAVLHCRRGDVIGGSLSRSGVYDLVMSEAVWRLLDPGEFAIDVGANLGYATAVMASRVGPGGTVWAFEPHPQLYGELVQNIFQLDSSTSGAVKTFQMAASDDDGEALLEEPDEFGGNRGTSRISATRSTRATTHSVETARLDTLLRQPGQVGLMKIDVEGHEPSVLRGADELLESQRVRDIVFEEHGTYPTPSTAILEQHGYTVFAIEKGLVGPVVRRPAAEPSEFRTRYDPRNLIASADPARLQNRMRHRGYRFLRSRK